MNRICLALMIVLLSLGMNFSPIAASGSDIDVYSPDAYGVPEQLGGYKVLAVLTNANLGCMGINEKRLVLQALDPHPELAIKKFNNKLVQQSLEANGLADFAKGGWEIVGPGWNRLELVSQFTKTKQNLKTDGCFNLGTLAPASFTTNSKTGSNEIKNYGYGYEFVINTDTALYPDAKAQSVDFIAPAIGNKQQAGHYSALLNNVYTDQSYFLQVGLYFHANGNGYIVWADDSTALIAQSFGNIPYVVGDAYYTTITLASSSTGVYASSGWNMCTGRRNDMSTYTCQYEPRALGTRLQAHPNTSIFAENGNTNRNWNLGFSSVFQAHGASIVRYSDGVSYPWTKDSFLVMDGCKQSYTPIISGDLANYGTINMPTAYIPLECDPPTR